MKYMLLIFISAVAIVIASCNRRDKKGEAKTAMIMDSVYSTDKNVTIVHPKDTIRLTESMNNFEDNPNIMQTDIDARKNNPSNEIQYVSSSDTIRLGEPRNRKSN